MDKEVNEHKIGLRTWPTDSNPRLKYVLSSKSIAQASGLRVQLRPLRFDACLSTLRNYRGSIQQKLRAGDDHFVAGLQAILDFVIIADGLSNLQRFLPGHIPAALLRLRHKCEILAQIGRAHV